MSQIVTVVARTSTSDKDPDLERLAAVPRIQPLISGSVDSASSSSSAWTDLFFASKPKADTSFALSPAPLTDILISLRGHSKAVTHNVGETQRKIGDRIVSTDEFCTSTIATLQARVAQAKGRRDVVNRVAAIQDAAVNTRLMLDDIMLSIKNLEPFLLPNERLDSPENIARYPRLTKMRSNSPNRSLQTRSTTPSPERSLSSSLASSSHSNSAKTQFHE
ncbi:hypothetical protein BDR26DRAFT_1004989 [Obelidium mucronatum]|nr:hypothetical protein BDR26DRAFT_1004989 [Obelidium mucronatum]